LRKNYERFRTKKRIKTREIKVTGATAQSIEFAYICSAAKHNRPVSFRPRFKSVRSGLVVLEKTVVNTGASKGGIARAKALSAERRAEIARTAGQARAAKLSPIQRSELAHLAAVARWSRRPRVATAKDAPGAVKRALRNCNPAELIWADPGHRYMIAWQVMVRGAPAAVKWLRNLLRPKDIRELVRRNRGVGCTEPEREKLRKKLRLSSVEIPVRPY
jgi:hypothetical protein